VPEKAGFVNSSQWRVLTLGAILRPTFADMETKAWFKNMPFWLTQATNTAGIGREQEFSGLLTGSGGALEAPIAEHLQPMGMGSLREQFGRAFPHALGAFATHEATVVEEEA